MPPGSRDGFFSFLFVLALRFGSSVCWRVAFFRPAISSYLGRSHNRLHCFFCKTRQQRCPAATQPILLRSTVPASKTSNRMIAARPSFLETTNNRRVSRRKKLIIIINAQAKEQKAGEPKTTALYCSTSAVCLSTTGRCSIDFFAVPEPTTTTNIYWNVLHG